MKISGCVWLINNKIIGWKIKKGEITEFSENTLNYQCMKYDDFKRFVINVPEFMNNLIFKLSKIWFRQWKLHELFKGFKPY